MIRQRMIGLFWEDEQFTEDVAMKMKKVMLEDLNSNRKEEYMSGAGLIMLFDRTGGKLTKKMRDVVVKVEVNSQHTISLLMCVPCGPPGICKMRGKEMTACSSTPSTIP